MSQYFITSVILLSIFLTKVESHGYLSNPPARNAAWKYGFKVPPNYDVMSLNCVEEVANAVFVVITSLQRTNHMKLVVLLPKKLL